MIKKRKGQGLLETIVAFSVLITGIVSLMSLVIMASIGRRSSEAQTVAAQLAREGIEEAVMLRNQNWLRGQLFDVELFSGTDYTATSKFNTTTHVWSLDFAANAISDGNAVIYRYAPEGDFPGLMVQSVGAAPADSVDTGYRRLIALDPICFDGSNETTVTSGSSCVSSPGKIGIRVTSTVQWKEKNGDHSISAVETIYDWR